MCAIVKTRCFYSLPLIHFTAAFLLKTNLNFFQVLQSALLKSKKKSRKRCKPCNSCLAKQETEKKTLKKEKKKRKM